MPRIQLSAVPGRSILLDMDWRDPELLVPLLRNLLASLLLVVVVLVAAKLGSSAVRRITWPTPEWRRRWLVIIRNVGLLVTLLGLIVIWATELQTVALSLVAIAVAVVVATKELLLCIWGGLLRSGVRYFAVGDRVEVAGIRGDVIDVNMLTTTVLEIGPGRPRTSTPAGRWWCPMRSSCQRR